MLRGGKEGLKILSRLILPLASFVFFYFFLLVPLLNGFFLLVFTLGLLPLALTFVSAFSASPHARYRLLGLIVSDSVA